MIWDKCPTLVAGQEFDFALIGSKVVLTNSEKSMKFALIQSVPLSGIQATSQGMADVAGQSANAPGVPVSHLKISSNVEGAEITIDGNLMGSTPSVIALPIGKHEVEINKDGFVAWQRHLVLSNGEISLHVDLHETVKP